MKIRTDKNGRLHVEGGKIKRRGTRVIVTTKCSSTQYNKLLIAIQKLLEERAEAEVAEQQVQ